MREIKFRGKRIYNGEWVEGSLCQGENRIFIVYDNDFTVSTIYGETNLISDRFFEVDPATVGQYTGLTDKNGKEIYEGDIVTTDIKRPYLIVEFRDGSFMFNCNDGGKDYYDIMMPIMKEPQSTYKYGEIIGNIYENPELIKEG